MTFWHGKHIGALLIDEGLCPPNARDVQVHIPADGAVFIRYDVLVSTEDMHKLSRVLAKMSDRKTPPLEPET